MELIEALPRLIGWAIPIIILVIIICRRRSGSCANTSVASFFAREITWRKRTGIDFSHPDCRSDGANGFARRHHQCGEAGGDDA